MDFLSLRAIFTNSRPMPWANDVAVSLLVVDQRTMQVAVIGVF